MIPNTKYVKQYQCLLHDDDIELLSVQLMLKTTQNAKNRRKFTNFNAAIHELLFSDCSESESINVCRPTRYTQS